MGAKLSWCFPVIETIFAPMKTDGQYEKIANNKNKRLPFSGE